MAQRYTELLRRLRERAPRALPRATAQMIDEAEAELGFPLPRLLRAVYRSVGNGGFGPSKGLIGVPGTEPYLSGAESVVELYDIRIHCVRGDETREERWPELILPFCDYGCASFACVDCSRSRARVLLFDADRWGVPLRKCLLPLSRSLEEWFEEWLRERRPAGPWWAS
jgi:hypothetical protein